MVGCRFNNSHFCCVLNCFKRCCYGWNSKFVFTFHNSQKVFFFQRAKAMDIFFYALLFKARIFLNKFRTIDSTYHANQNWVWLTDILRNCIFENIPFTNLVSSNFYFFEFCLFLNKIREMQFLSEMREIERRYLHECNIAVCQTQRFILKFT